MSTNPDEPTSRSADENPYAPPQATIGGTGSAEMPADMAEAEAIRRKYLSHEASVTSIGSLHYLGVIVGIIALAMTVFRALYRTPEVPEGIDSVLFVATAVYLFVFVSVNLLLGIGLTGLKSSARWTEVVLSSILLLIYLIVIVSTAV